METYYEPAFYKHNEKFNILGPLLGLAFGTAAAFPLAFGYAYIARYIPFIYLNWIVSFGAVFLVALAFVAGERMGKNRNRGASLISALIMSVITLYIFWAAFLHVLSKGAFSFTSLLFHPKDMMRLIEALVEVGWFSLKRARVRGLFYGILLAVEAAVYVGIFIAVWWSMLLQGVFCEGCNSWGSEEKLPFPVDQGHAPQIVAGMKTGDWSFISQLSFTSHPSTLLFEITRCSGNCPSFILLSLIKNDVIQGKDGPEATETYLLKNLHITGEQLEQINSLEALFQQDAPAEPPVY
ncbi:hypothetical protein KKF84_13860 [Myxococcota bacterium]|nr:hypothetical protein [Myxococcota bacterium]